MNPLAGALLLGLIVGAGGSTLYWHGRLSDQRARGDQLEASLGAQAEGVKLLKQAAARREMDARQAQAAAERAARQVPCRVTLPPRPVYATEALSSDAGIYDQVRALLAERRQRMAYEAQLEAAARACS
ncbi:hypothetical protein ABXN37_22535 [Piscinibacter sakaiensis]|uniref:hypothetical protein n=1 Tax=Piscinibacter sakaiensis TaxID=1547922 RepID=UPI003729B98D